MQKLADGPYQPQDIEENILKFWLEGKLYKPETARGIFAEQKWRGENAGIEKFSIINPPPNAYARPHMGNVSGYAYQDLFGRRARMQGKTTLLFPGKDHAAQQAEIVYIRDVLAPEGKKREDFSREEFYAQAYEYFTGIAKIAQDDEKRIGLSADFDRDLFTLDPRVAKTVYKTFDQLWQDKMVYKGVRIVNWSPGLNSAVADIDTERKTIDSKMYYIKYAVPGTAAEVREFEEKYRGTGEVEVEIVEYFADEKVALGNFGDVQILFAAPKEIEVGQKMEVDVIGMAIFLNAAPKLIGSLDSKQDTAKLFKFANEWGQGGSAFIKLFDQKVPEEFAENFYSRGFIIGTVRPETKFGDTAMAVNPNDARYAHLLEKDLDLVSLNGPVKIRVIADQAVDPEFGTGILKVTPAHAPTDYEIYLRYNAAHPENPIGYKNVIGKDSRLNHIAGIAEGRHAEEEREQIAELLKSHGFIVFEEPTESNIVICERTKTIIQPIMSSQWFVDTDKLKAPALEAVREEKVKIHPDYMTKKLEIWLENLRDWPISRSIWWGYRFPVWYKGEITEATDENGQLVVKIGGQAIADMQDGIAKGLIRLELEPNVEKLTSEGWVQDTDVFDTWFSSGQWPYATLTAEDLMDYYPTSVMETGFDILELWVSRMLMLGIYTQGDVPFKDVYLHGLIKAEDGQKMSKSKGNIVYTSDIIAEYGADALRMLYIVGNKAGASYRVDSKKLKGYRNFLNKIWNASKFILNNLDNELTPELLQQTAKRVQALENVKVSEESSLDLAEFKNVAKAEIAEKLATEKVNIDALLLENLTQLTASINNHMDNFRPGMAAEEIYLNFWQLFADIYIEQVKARLFLYDREKNAINRDEAGQKSRQEALAHLLFALKTYLKLLHPFIPFITEHIWQALPEELRESETILYSRWP